MSKIRHIAIIGPDPDEAGRSFRQVFHSTHNGWAGAGRDGAPDEAK